MGEEMTGNLPDLGGAGLVPNLYEYLWTMNNLLQSRCMFHKCPPVHIPDTVLLKNKNPTSWYYSSLKSGTLQRRSTGLSTSKVSQALISQQDPSTDIVCVFVGSAAGDVQPITEYLSATGLEYFLAAPPSRRTKGGILQSFIHPKGTSNFVIRVSWTPESCSMDSCININKLSDPDLGTQERAATNDEKNCVLIPTSGNVIATQLERLCACVAEHVTMVTQHQINVKSMILNFKIDNSDRVWLLWCEHMELSDEQGNLIRRASPENKNGTALEETDGAPKGGTPKGKNNGKATSGSSKGWDEQQTQKSKMSDWGEDPVLVDSEDEDGESYENETMQRSRSLSKNNRIRDDMRSEDELAPRTNSSASESVEPTDYILIPEGMKDRKLRKASSVKGNARKPTTKAQVQVQDETTPRSDASSSDALLSPREDKRRGDMHRNKTPAVRGDRGEKKKTDPQALIEERKALQRQMAEEKRKREQAEKKALEAAESLKRAEAKANALKAMLRRAESGAAENLSESSDTAAGKAGSLAKTKRTKSKDETLPKIPGHVSSRPSSQGAPQAPLVRLESDPSQQSVVTASVSDMAEEIARAADIAIDQDSEDDNRVSDESGEEDVSALTDMKHFGKKEEDVWEDDIATGDTSKFFSEKDDAEEPTEHEETVAKKKKDVITVSAGEEQQPVVKVDTANVEDSAPPTEDKPSTIPTGYKESSKVDPSKQPAVIPHASSEKEGDTQMDSSQFMAGAETRQMTPQSLPSTGNVSVPVSSSNIAVSNPVQSTTLVPATNRFDQDEYEDKPIGNVPSILAEKPVPRVSKGPATAEVSAAEIPIQHDTAVIANPMVSFAVESTPSVHEVPTVSRAAVKSESEVQDVNEFEVKGKKYEFQADPSPSNGEDGASRIVGTGPSAEPLQRNWAGDEIGRDARSVNQDGLFRSELRVGTSFEKWNAHGISTVMEGSRVGSTVSVFSMGELALTFSSMFDDDGLQPKHAQQLMKGTVGVGSEDLNNRCSNETHLSKATPDPVPDFHQPIEEPQQSSVKESTMLDLGLPAKKMKGTAEKRRDNQIEMICMPIEKDLDPNEPEDISKLKAEFGLPDVLWKHDEIRGSKFDVGRDSELMREANESRLIERPGRTKGVTQGQIDVSNLVEESSEEFKGYATEAIKVVGSGASDYQVRAREPCIDYVAKHVEWVYDEYLRSHEEVVSKSQPDPVTQELSEVMEMKFEVAFSSDEERNTFASAQREKLAKMLGIPVQFIEIVDVKPGSPITMVRFQIKGSDAAMIPSGSTESGMSAPPDTFDAPAIAVSMLKTGGEDGHRQLGHRLREVFGDSTVEDRAVQAISIQTAPSEVLDSKKAYSREDTTEPRKVSDVRSKGGTEEAVPGSRVEEEPHQHVVHSGEHNSTPSFTAKDKGSTSSVDSDEVERIYKPGREIMQDDQFSSAKVQRRPPKPPKRLKEISLALENDLEEQVKVPYEEVDNTRRLKEQEDELNFLPAQRAVLAARTAILAKKHEGLEDSRYDFLMEHDQRKEEKRKEDASRQPSLKLSKAVEEIEYELAQKITGFEDPRTVVPCEPAGLSSGDRRSKKKGKDGERLSIAAVPEAYMAFGLEKDSQRLAPSVVTLDKPGSEKIGAISGMKDQPELIDASAPSLIQFKFDASFVDERSRLAFAEAQRLKMAKLLRIPEDAISVRFALPGSPITIVTFEIEPGVAKRAYDGVEPVFSSRPFDCPVLDVEVTSPQDEEAEALMKKVKGVLGPKVNVVRLSLASGKTGPPMKDKNVKFESGRDDAPQPAYLRSRNELEGKAMLRQRGALTSDKEAVETSADVADDNKGGERRNLPEAGMGDKKPILSFDRRLPKNAKNKQHLLARIHTIESTLQRLYGKLEVDSELPEIDSIEQIMSNTIKQAVYTQDNGVEVDDLKAGPAKRDPGPMAKMDPIQTPVKSGGQEIPENDDDFGGEAEEDAPIDDVERRNKLRADRRKRMEERERIRTEKQSLDVKPKSGSTVRFESSVEGSESQSPLMKESSVRGGSAASLQHLKDLQNEDSLALYPSNIPSVALKGDQDDGVSNVISKKKMAALSEIANDHEAANTKKPAKSSRSEGEDEGMDRYELQQMAANGSDGWKAAFSKVRHGKRADIILMLDAGCPVELKDDAGNSLLNIAAQNGHKSIIKALLRSGASINTQNHKGQTPLHFCFTYGFTDLGNYLISKGGDDTVQNFAGLTCYEGLGD